MCISVSCEIEYDSLETEGILQIVKKSYLFIQKMIFSVCLGPGAQCRHKQPVWLESQDLSSEWILCWNSKLMAGEGGAKPDCISGLCMAEDIAVSLSKWARNMQWKELCFWTVITLGPNVGSSAC